MKTNKTNRQKKSNQGEFPFPWGDSQKMAEMMKNCCPDQGGNDCCSMMKKMMESVSRRMGQKEKEPPPGENQNR